ncbi:MAG: hypothetical protein GEV12_04450 [Micromonosporaceae bacterium]|nr:hypothetical protein [Micromonosporaceae bacterium]
MPGHIGRAVRREELVRITRWAAVAALGVAAGAVALAGPAQADHNIPDIGISQFGDCGETSINTFWSDGPHMVGDTVLVLQVDGEQHLRFMGESIVIGPFTADPTIRWRVWGGGERNYDDPPLTDLEALLAYLEENPDGELDPDPPGVAWHTLELEGCPEPEPSPSPEPEPTGPACVDVNTASAEELKLLKHIDDDRAAQILELRPFASVADLDRVDGLRAGGPNLAELVAGGDGFLPLCDIAGAPGGGGGGTGDDDKGLPVTGTPAALIGAGGAGLLALGGGAYLLARKRRVSFTA